MTTPSVSIIVPVYNSESTLEELVRRLGAALDGCAGDLEIVLVNDGSRDASWAKIRELAESDPRVHGINLMRNYGQHNALLAGIRAARREICVTIDDDLQNPPEEIPKLLTELDKGFDVVYGTPEAERHGLMRDLASQITKVALQGSMGVDMARRVSAFRVFRTRLRDAFTQYRASTISIDVLLTWATTRFASVSVRHEVRSEGESNYTFRKLVAHALNMLTGYSVLPLQLASLMGVAFSLIGMFVLVFVVGRFLLQGSSVPGFPFLASTIAIFSGAQLLALGVIGEYLARMHFRMMDRPAYMIRETSRDGGSGDEPGV